MTVIWCDPPAYRPGSYFRALEEVRARPGEWAIVRLYDAREKAHDGARYLRRSIAVKPAGRWSFCSGFAEGQGGQWGVWARWDGE